MLTCYPSVSHIGQLHLSTQPKVVCASRLTSKVWGAWCCVFHCRINVKYDHLLDWVTSASFLPCNTAYSYDMPLGR